MGDLQDVIARNAVSSFNAGYNAGKREERLQIKLFILEWASERDLGVDALLARIDGKPVIKDEEFEIPDWSEEVAEIKQARSRK